MRKYKGMALLTLVLVFALAMAVGGCKPGGSDAPKVIKIGVHTSLTGDLADYGYTAAEGIKLANTETPEVVVGGETYKIELVIKDDKMDPAESAIVAQSLVDEGVIGVIGCLTSGATNAAGPIYSQAGVVQVTGSATKADLTEKGWGNFFRTCVGDQYQSPELAKWAKELGFKKVVVFDDSSDYAVGLADGIAESFKTEGVESKRESAKDTDTDFSAQIANIKAFGADCVIFTGYHKQAGILRKQLVEQGLDKVQVMGGDGIKSDEIVAEAGGAPNATGMLCTVGGIDFSAMSNWDKFKTDYKAATSKDPGPYAETNHDGYVAIVNAIKKADSIDKAAVVAAMKTGEVDGVVGLFGFNDKGDIVMKGASSSIATINRFKCDGKTWVSAK